MMRFLEHRIGDRRVLRLISKWLKAGVMEDGVWTEGTVGTPQGAVISPLLANIYLHYVYDPWVEQWRKRTATGPMIVVRYADDTIVGFQRHAIGASRPVDSVDGLRPPSLSTGPSNASGRSISFIFGFIIPVSLDKWVSRETGCSASRSA